jgi:chromosome segregation ATPase
VTSDIKQASEISFNSVSGKTLKVVTQKGEMIDTTGVLTGGGKPKKGLMDNKIVEEFTDGQI